MGGTRWFASYLLVNLPRKRASSSVAEQGTFNPRVVGSIPTWLTSPHRLEAQDTALSRRRHGFESRWGHVPGALDSDPDSNAPTAPDERGRCEKARQWREHARYLVGNPRGRYRCSAVRSDSDNFSGAFVTSS
jgi:hypothetical protein